MSTAAFPLTEHPVRSRRRCLPFLRSAGGHTMDLYSLFLSDSAFPTFVEPRSFADVRQLYVQVKSYPFLSLYHCYVSRVEYCETKETTARHFVVAHISHLSSTRPIGYLMVAPHSHLDHALACKEKSNPSAANRSLGDCVFIFNRYSTISNLVGGSNFHVLFHAKLDTSTCPLLYLIAAGQTSTEHQAGGGATGQGPCWSGALLFRLICDSQQITRHRRARDRDQDLLALFEVPHLDGHLGGVYLQYAAEVTNIRKLLEDARARRVQALEVDVSAARGTVKTVEAATNIALLAKQAAGVAIQIARKEREMRKAAEKRERQARRAAELRECELLVQIAELKARC